jgi:Domain of unknown function (DUF5666)
MKRGNRRVVGPSLGLAVAVFGGGLWAGSAAGQKPTSSPVEIEGVASELTGACPAIKFKIAGYTVVTDARTEFDDGLCKDVANGKKVEVEGKVGQDGTLLASEVDLT